MTEILTESFCERCGTRYTFESARSRTRLTGVRTLSRGLKNFVLSDDTSMDEAMAAARSETDREATAHQLDAFHKTFTFCMSCRQYTCPNCWNEAEARCLSCAPLQEIVLAPYQSPFEETPAAAVAAAPLVADPWGLNGSNGSKDDHGALNGFEQAEAEAALDLESVEEIDAAARLAALTSVPSVVDAPDTHERIAAEIGRVLERNPGLLELVPGAPAPVPAPPEETPESERQAETERSS
jgi:hypothetical protein